MQAQSYILHNKKNKTINHQNSSTSSPHPSTASTWSNTFNSDQTSSTSSPHPLTASPINKTSNHQSSSTSRPNPSTTSPIAPHLHGPTSSTVILNHQLHHHDQLLIYALPFVVTCLPLIMTKVVYWQNNPFNSDVLFSQRISMSSVP